ncbi:MAG: cytochrome c biogenesis protein CcdA [candidate division Zixibacteria bacterium]|nr:cytochrome c biogenesis protein CcdA [candidate division Zixibacteria bacterium]
MFEQPTVEVPTAFLAGILSFLSPCVLPLIPGYLSFISGVTIEELGDASRRGAQTRRLILNTVFFVFGFSIVFVLLGVGASGIGHWLQTHLQLFNRIAGVVVFLFGLHVAGVFRISALNYEKRFHLQSGGKKKGIWGALFIGFAFAFGWTPCIGPILGSILTLAAQQAGVAQGVWLLTVYSAGLGIPFILTAILFNYLIGAFGFIKRHFRAVEIVSGALLMIVGVLIFFNLLQRISTFILNLFPALQNVG